MLRWGARWRSSSRSLSRIGLFILLVAPTQAPTDPPKSAEQSSAEKLWLELSNPNAAEAHAALCKLIVQPDTAVALLKMHLRPVRKDDKLERLLTALDSRRFAERETAMRELERLGPQAEPPLRRILDGKPSPELRKRIEDLLAKLDQPLTDPGVLRGIRAVEVLERIGSGAAQQLLAGLAMGEPDALLTREAQESLKRLRNRPVVKPDR